MGHDGHEHGDGHSSLRHEHAGHEEARDSEHGPAHCPDPRSPVRDPSVGRSSCQDGPPGPRGGRVLFFDAPSGLAGDMIIAALVDLGVPREVVGDAIAALPITGFDVTFGTRVQSGIVATAFDVRVSAPQPTRTYASIRAMLAESRLSDAVKARAQRTFLRLGNAEAKVHRTAIDDVHFHEVGAIDAIVDVVGSAAALDHLDAELWVSPLPMGHGFVRAAHGTLPLPAPATVECLAGLATYDGGLDFEFVTPTGAAIVGAHATGSLRWPAMAPERTGWGAGHASLSDRPNVLRAVLGFVPDLERGRASEALLRPEDAPPTHTVLEANIDDASGELAASWIETLLVAGALDAWATPITMKKGRPALVISALVGRDRADELASTMLRETTSLGVRCYDVRRLERPRTIEYVETPFGLIAVKIAGGPFGPPQIKPEFDACAEAARAHGVPVREVLRVVMSLTAKRAMSE
jgi:uncharacterized protein (TIGR00299 family) protein